LSTDEPPVVQPWLRLEYEQRRAFLWPDEAAAVCDVLRSKDEPPAQRLSAVIASAVTTLQASPLHAGTRPVRVSEEELPFLLDAADLLEQNPFDRYAKLKLGLGGEGA